ncbi:MAG TPA: Gfo/Idh/MocA family oxidoreductase [Acidobacteriaceae bacterium]
MNRREFARMSALSLAATQLPAVAVSQPARKIGYAPVGLGQISSIFMRAVANSSTTKITGLVSGHPEKAARFAEMYGVPRTSIYNYEDFDRIRENKDIDATYIGLPNSMHKEFTIRSAQAGKHVLCEKPMAISSAECREMIAACRKADRKLMIAYRIHYDPTHLKAVALIKQGRIGDIQYCEGNFGSYFHPNQWRLTRALGGGGPLMDMGIYPLNTIRFYTGVEPVRFAAKTSTMDRQSGRFQDIEESLSWTMEMSSGVLANCATSYTTRLPGYINVIGNKGSILVSTAYSYDGLRLEAHLDDPDGKSGSDIHEDATGKMPFQFQIEAEDFANCILQNKESRTPGEEGLKDMQAIEQIYIAAGHPIA